MSASSVRPNPAAAPATPPNPQTEREQLLSNEQLINDPRWQDAAFRSQNVNLVLALDGLQKFMAGEITDEKFKKKLDAWVNSEEYTKDPAFSQAVVNQFHGQLRKFSAVENADRAGKATPLLPAEKVEKKAEPEAAPKPEEKKDEVEEESSGDKHFSVGLEFHNDTFLNDIILKKVFQINLDSVFNEKADFTFKVPFTFSGGPLKLMARPYGGMFQSRAIPGTEIGETGRGYKVGADFGVVNPYGKDFEAAGLGIEATGIASHAGEESGIDAPGPVVRLHLFKQNDWAWPVAGNLQLGVNTLFNYQETFFVLGNNSQLLPEGEATDFSTAGELFARNKFNLLGLSLRYYPNGAPQKDPIENTEGAFRPGEAWPKIGGVFVGSQINRNRRRGIPPFANNRVFLGTFETLGAQSRDQYDLLGTGLSLFSFLDGAAMAGNAVDRAEVWRRGDWTERGVMIGLDGVNLITDIVLAAKAEDDPPEGQTVEEFAANPGSVNDFEGRAGKMNLYMNLFELGLSGLEVSGAFGRRYKENKLHYGLAHGATFLAGIPLFFFSAPISGADCAPDGTALFRCGFGTTANTKGQYFSEDTFDAGPEDIAQVERQYMISSFGAALLSHGASGLINLAVDAIGKDDKPSGGKPVKGADTATAPTINLQVGPNGGGLSVQGRF